MVARYMVPASMKVIELGIQSVINSFRCDAIASLGFASSFHKKYQIIERDKYNKSKWQIIHWTFSETGDKCKLLKPELNLKKSAPSSCCFLAMSRFNSSSFSFSHYCILLWNLHKQFNLLQVCSVLLLRLTTLYLVTKKGEVLHIIYPSTGTWW